MSAGYQILLLLRIHLYQVSCLYICCGLKSLGFSVMLGFLKYVLLLFGYQFLILLFGYL
jgi:hypothetical protein